MPRLEIREIDPDRAAHHQRARHQRTTLPSPVKCARIGRLRGNSRWSPTLPCSSPTSSTARRPRSGWVTSEPLPSGTSTTGAHAIYFVSTTAARSAAQTACSCCSRQPLMLRAMRCSITRKWRKSGSRRVPECTWVRSCCVKAPTTMSRSVPSGPRPKALRFPLRRGSWRWRAAGKHC